MPSTIPTTRIAGENGVWMGRTRGQNVRLCGMGLDKLDQRSRESGFRQVRPTGAYVIPADAGISPSGCFRAAELPDQVRDDEGISAPSRGSDKVDRR